MARPIRIELPGALYYIVASGADGSILFDASGKKTLFLHLLREIKHSHGLVIHGYSLLKNQYHLLLRTPHANLSKAMTRLQGIYSAKYKAINQRKGSVFAGRYRGYLVDGENYLEEVIRYLHLYPMHIGMIKKPEKYPWSSFRAYLGDDPYGLVDTQQVLACFGRDKERAKYKLWRYVLKNKEEYDCDLLREAYGGCILGDREFVKEIRRKCGELHLSKEVREAKFLRTNVSKEAILRKVRATYCEDKTMQKKAAVYLMRKLTDMRLREIAAEFGDMHCSSVTQIVKRNKEKFRRNKKLLEIEADLSKMRE